MTSVPHPTESSTTAGHSLSRVSYESYRILQFVFIVAPILAGLDKFFDLLTHWEQYLSPVLARIVGGNAHTFMMIVGVIEIIAGIGVALKPKYFGYVVAAWLLGIIINLLSLGMYFDIALRDLGLMLAALALARLAMFYDVGPTGGLMAHRR
jgi:hypothetical protein